MSQGKRLLLVFIGERIPPARGPPRRGLGVAPPQDRLEAPTELALDESHHAVELLPRELQVGAERIACGPKQVVPGRHLPPRHGGAMNPVHGRDGIDRQPIDELHPQQGPLAQGERLERLAEGRIEVGPVVGLDEVQLWIPAQPSGIGEIRVVHRRLALSSAHADGLAHGGDAEPFDERPAARKIGDPRRSARCGHHELGAQPLQDLVGIRRGREAGESHCGLWKQLVESR
jgi:hypothetical protein